MPRDNTFCFAFVILLKATQLKTAFPSVFLKMKYPTGHSDSGFTNTAYFKKDNFLLVTIKI